MPDSLPDLEADRAKLFQQMQTLGDFRPGSISAVVRRCGKSTCHCAQPDDAGHDPQFRLTRKADGKTVTDELLHSRRLPQSPTRSRGVPSVPDR